MPMQDSSRIISTQTIAVSGTTASSSAFSSETFQVRVSSDTACNYKVGEGAASNTASTADPFLPVNWVEYVTVTPGQKIAAIRASTDGTVTAASGTLWITELT